MLSDKPKISGKITAEIKLTVTHLTETGVILKFETANDQGIIRASDGKGLRVNDVVIITHNMDVK